MRDNLKKVGYGQEEEYFYRLNRELIEMRRRKLDEERQVREANERRNAHWMKCPKCGCDLAEQDLRGIKVERCTSCKGVYIDQGEIATLLHTYEPHGFFATIRRMWKGSL